MGNVCFFDLSNDGHHWFYNSHLIFTYCKKYQVYYYTRGLTIEQKELLMKKGVNYKEFKAGSVNGFIGNITKLVILLKLYFYCINKNIAKLYILYLDPFIIQMYMCQYLFKLFKIKIISTLHWYPNKKIKRYYLSKFVKDNRMVVHTEDIKTKIDGENVFIIPYPVSNSEFITKEDAKLKLKYNCKNKITLLYFGSTRYDKGLDLLLEALQLVKHEINLIIAGSESDIKSGFIKQRLKSLKNINCLLNLLYVHDQDIKYYFSLSDIVILPYRKIFSGESGVLAEAINYGKVIIVPNINHIPSVVNQYNNGIVFECENILDMADKIGQAIENYNEYLSNSSIAKEKFKEEHSLEKFVERYLNIRY